MEGVTSDVDEGDNLMGSEGGVPGVRASEEDPEQLDSVPELPELCRH